MLVKDLAPESTPNVRTKATRAQGAVGAIGTACRSMIARLFPMHPDPSAALTSRVEYLDGLRGLAILLVIGYHYYVRFASGTQQFYPYGDLFSGFLPFRYGYFGLQLFFAISGFVIALSLEHCHSIGEFAIRRFARLWPTMLLCSLLTSALLAMWPRFWTPALVNLLPSLSFIDGKIWNEFMPQLRAGWVDGAYWSLFVEVRFYALAAIVYFLSPRRFMPALAAVAALMIATQVALNAAGRQQWAAWLGAALITSYLPWFLLGVAALADRRARGATAAGLLLLAGTLLLALVPEGERPVQLVALVTVIALLLGAPRIRSIRRVLSHPCLSGIGAASYSLYLLHQDAGITLITVIADLLSLHGAIAGAVSLLVIALLLAVARCIFILWETPMNRAIVGCCLNGRPAPASDPKCTGEVSPRSTIGTPATIGSP